MKDDGVQAAVLFAVWDKLSQRARQDLKGANRPGSVIRCTAADMDLLRCLPLGSLQELQELMKVGSVEGKGDLDDEQG